MTTKTRNRLRIHVSLEHDEDTQSPFDEDVFSLCSMFSGGRGAMYELIEKLKEENRVKGETWWWVSCYRHGGEHWFLEGQTPAGADNWDTTGKAGILYLDDHDPSYVGPTPQEAAEGVLETYNRWCSGDSWYFSVKWDVETKHEGTCPCCETPDVHWIETHVDDYEARGGIIGLEYALEELAMIFQRIKEENPDNISRYEVAISGDQAGQAYDGDVAAKVREIGFRVLGDPKDES